MKLLGRLQDPVSGPVLLTLTLLPLLGVSTFQNFMTLSMEVRSDARHQLETLRLNVYSKYLIALRRLALSSRRQPSLEPYLPGKELETQRN